MCLDTLVCIQKKTMPKIRWGAHCAPHLFFCLCAGAHRAPAPFDSGLVVGKRCRMTCFDRGQRSSERSSDLPISSCDT